MERNAETAGGKAVKRCWACARVLPVAAFGKNCRNADGLHSECRECRRKAWRDKHGGLPHALRAFTTDELAEELSRRSQ